MNIETLTPAVIIIVEGIKRSGTVDIKFVPLVSLVIGVAVSLLANGITVDSALTGLLVGGLAAGIYSAGKSTLKIAGLIPSK